MQVVLMLTKSFDARQMEAYWAELMVTRMCIGVPEMSTRRGTTQGH